MVNLLLAVDISICVVVEEADLAKRCERRDLLDFIATEMASGFSRVLLYFCNPSFVETRLGTMLSSANLGRLYLRCLIH